MSDNESDSTNERLKRLGRLTLKELREILRDHRTIVTLVLMPLLMYPVMSIAFQQFFVSQLGTHRTPRYTVGFHDDREAAYFEQVLALGGLKLVKLGEPAVKRESRTGQPEAVVEGGVRPGLEAGLEEYDIHVGLRLVNRSQAGAHFDPRHDLAADVELLYLPASIASRNAAAYVEKHLAAASEKFLEARLRHLGVTQRAVPLRVVRRAVEETEVRSAGGAISITAVVPFILILMTVTGAVYPAIDLTAGERERGTLEVLIAAPIPRMGVLLAKYVAVLTVALLTAAANLLTMTVTISVTGLGEQLFGESGLSPGVIAAIFGLLLLFAAFFSAVLLAITSCARSFKEAQAYLIPLMLVSLAPGMLSLMPDIELSGLLLVTPLANIVLLGRDLFALKASGLATTIVVASTLLYAGAAIGLAARIFGAESVLYSTQSGWSDLLHRPREPQSAPTVTAAIVCLALMFPAYFLLINLLGRFGEHLLVQQVLGAAMTALIFGGFPLVVCRLRRVAIAPVFRLPRSAPVVFAAAVVLGLSFWTCSHEMVVLIQKWRDVSFDPNLVKRLGEYAGRLRDLPVLFVWLTMAVTPAFFEEAFFRGYLFSALRSHMSAATAILTTAIVFGLFHVVAPNPLASERFVSSTVVGLLLGWVYWRTGSLLPGIVLHSTHNGLLILLAYYEPELAARNIGVSQDTHLPATWLAAGALSTCAGAAMLYLATRHTIGKNDGAQEGT